MEIEEISCKGLSRLDSKTDQSS